MSSMRVCPVCQTETPEITCPREGAATLAPQLTAAGLIGQTVQNRYEILDLIGEGGYGAVYRARHTGTGEAVALKVLRVDQADNADSVARFRQEAAITSGLKQPHTVRVFDYGQTANGDPYLAMEFLQGRTLSDVLAQDHPVDPGRLVTIALQVLKSLAEAHSKGLVHRDLKPDNIFLTAIMGEDDFAKVLDFGIAKSLAGDGVRTATGVIVGTPPYMSPEQARGSGVDHRTDLYSLGCILYQGLTGQLAFASASPIDTLVMRITTAPPSARGHCLLPTPDALCDAVRKAMATHAADRFADAAEMSSALKAALGITGTGAFAPVTAAAATAPPPAASPLAPAVAAAASGVVAEGTTGSAAAKPKAAGLHEVATVAMSAIDASQLAAKGPETTLMTAEQVAAMVAKATAAASAAQATSETPPSAAPSPDAAPEQRRNPALWIAVAVAVAAAIAIAAVMMR